MAKLTIDEFVIALGFDASKLTKGQQEAVKSFKRTQEEASARAQQMEKDGDRAAAFFGKIKGEALALGAVLIGANGLKDYVGKTVGSLVQLGVVSGNIGLAAREAAAFQMVMERNGDAAGAALGTLQKIAQIQQGYRTGVMPDKTYIQGLGFIGGTAQDNPVEIFEKFAKWAEGKDRQRVSQIGGWLGFDDAQIAQASKGLKNFQDQMKEARENGPSEQDVKNAQELNNAFKELSQTIQGLARGPLISLLHELVGFLKDIDRLGQEGKKNATGNPFLDTWNTITGRHDGVQAPRAPTTSVDAGRRAIANGTWAGTGGAPTTSAGAGVRAIANGSRAGTGGKISDAVMWGRGGLVAADSPAARAAQIKAYYEARGWTSMAAAGISAGIGAETGGSYDPTKKNPNSTAYGLGQWTKSSGRQALFRRYFGKDIHDSTFEEQLAFLNLEMTYLQRGAGNAVGRAKSGREALDAYVRRVMAPGYAGIALDLRNGEQWLGRLGGGGTSVVVENVNVNVPNGDPHTIARGVSGALQTVMQANGGPH